MAEEDAFLVNNVKGGYVLTTPMPKLLEDATVEAIILRAKWKNDDYICRGHILNGMILGQYTQHVLKMDESISVSSIIDKFPPSWKDFKHALKHGKDDLSLVQLCSHLRIEESLRAQDSNKGKGKDVGGPSVNMTEKGGKNKHHKQNKGKKRSNENKSGSGSNKKPKLECWKRGKTGHFKRDYRTGKRNNTNAGGSGKESKDQSQDQGQNSVPVWNGFVKFSVSLISEAFYVQVDGIAWWIDSGATTHVCKDRSPYTPQQNGVTERKNKALKEMVNSMLSYSGLSEGFWGEAMLTACYLLNRIPNKREKTTPYELWLQWIFKRKMKVNRIVDKFKARLVIQGFRQKEWIDYFDTFAPVARITTIKLMLALAAIQNLVIHQMDVKTAFLNGDLDKEVYLKQPGGFIMPVDKIKKFLSSRFSMKDMGEAYVILGIKIKRENKGIVITQSHYIEKILKKFNREDCSLMSTHMDLIEKLKPNTRKPVDQLKYSRAIGCLMYAMTSTRLDIAYVVSRLSRFTSNPSRHHWKAITRVFKYLRGTNDYGLSYVGYPSVLEGYSDASWINHVEDSSFTSGWVFSLRGCAISWASKKQTCITGSTMESEFVALVAAVFVVIMAGNTVKDMTTNFRKLDKFEGHDFRRWQKKMHFLLTTSKVVYVLTTPMPELLEDATVKAIRIRDSLESKYMAEDSSNSTVEAIRIREKWENDDYLCQGHILNGMSDSLFNVYTNVESAKELWDSFESKYMAGDSLSKKFLVSNFNNYKMVDSRPVMEQYNKHLSILRQYTQHGLKMDESISILSIIDKFPPSWKDFKNTLKHGKDDLSLVQLDSHLRIEESLRVQDSDKVKGKKVGGPSVNMTEEGGKNKHHKQSKGKRRSNEKNSGSGSNKKPKLECWKCGKTGHFRRNCHSGKKNNANAGGLGKGCKDQSQDQDSGATTHVCKDRCWFKTFEPGEDVYVLYMGDDHFAPVHGKGSMALEFSFGKAITLFNVFYVPKLRIKKYVITFIDDASRFFYVYLLHAKDEAFDKFRIYKTEVELQQNELIKSLRTDRGGEYYDPVFFQSIGIIHETIAAYTPQQNSVAERKNRALKEMVNSMLSYSSLSEGFWGEARLTACYLLNRVPNKRIKTTPYELWYKKQLKLAFLQVWGCRAVVRLPDPKWKTLGEKGIDCIFVGYAEHSKAYRFYIIETNDSVSINSIIESRDAIFAENHFSSIPRPNDIIPNLDESQRDDHSDYAPNEIPEPQKGFRQKEGIDYFDTYAPVACITTIRLLLALAAIHNLVIHQMDVKTAFLNGDLDEEVYMKQPEGFIMPEAYSDASWINHVEDSSSTSEWVFQVGGGAISWASKKQTCIAGSTMESEFVALAAVGKEAEWLRNLIHEILIWPKPIAPISIRCDSVPTMAKAYSQIYNGKSRHLGIRHSMEFRDEDAMEKMAIYRWIHEFHLMENTGTSLIFFFNKIKIDQQKVKAITDWPRPSSVTEIRTFMGAYQYLHKSI
nr:zinc finger, CCHC-type [Tanacetum cinerariifolium]